MIWGGGGTGQPPPQYNGESVTIRRRWFPPAWESPIATEVRRPFFPRIRRRFDLGRRVAIAGTVLLLGADPIQAQLADPPTLYLIRESRDRLLQGTERPDFKPFAQDRTTFRMGIRTLGEGREATRTWNLRWKNTEADIGLTSDNRVRYTSIRHPPLFISENRQGSLASDRRRGLRAGIGDDFTLRLADLWEVPFVAPAGPLTVGTSWADTLEFSADPGEGLYGSLSGVWSNQVVGDSVIGGITHAVIASRASVEFLGIDLWDDPSNEEPVRVTRRFQGSITGYVVFDRDRRLRMAGTDTTTWTGEGELTLQDGRSFTEPARYDRVRTWHLLDQSGFDAEQAARYDQRERVRSGMLVFPTSTLQERVGTGDRALADSLMGVYAEAEDPQVRRDVEGLLNRWHIGNREARDSLQTELLRLRESLGDTAGTVAHRLGDMPRPVDENYLESILPYLDDPGRAWSLGLFVAWPYRGLADQALASPENLRATARAVCTAEACARLRLLATNAQEERLRDVGLVARFAEDPARWSDSILARAAAGSKVVEAAHARVIGSAAAPGRSDAVAMPDAEAGWGDWALWLGENRTFGESHRQALDYWQRRTGVDPLASLADGWPPEGDSARLILGRILRGMDLLPPSSPDEILADLLSGAQPRIDEAQRALSGLLHEPGGTPASPELAREIQSPLLQAVTLQSDSPWPMMDGIPTWGDRVIHSHGVSFHGVDSVPGFVLSDDLDPAILAELPEGFAPISRSEWSARSPREGGLLIKIFPVETIGPFVFVRWDWTVHRQRDPDYAPSGYAGGGSLWLVEAEGAWRVVSSGAWIT